MSKEELHDMAIEQLEADLEAFHSEPQGEFKYYVRGKINGLVYAYYVSGIISYEEKQKYCQP